MTKKEIKEIIKRYSKLAQAMKEEKETADFYIGNRKHAMVISEEVKKIFQIIDDIYLYENCFIRKIIDGLKKGKGDIAIICVVPWEKTDITSGSRK